MAMRIDYVVLISSNTEWQVVRDTYPNFAVNTTPLGQWFAYAYQSHPELAKPVLIVHGGWGKVAAAASTQYVIDKWRPRMVINLGTCGGFDGEISEGTVILVEKTVIYDIYEQMGDPDEHIRYYSTDIDNSWVIQPCPIPVVRSLLVSGDRDLFSHDIPMLKERYGAIAGDWESGAIAWIAHRNHVPCLILRGVTDVVGGAGDAAYDGNARHYSQNTRKIMPKLLESLPEWLLMRERYITKGSSQH